MKNRTLLLVLAGTLVLAGCATLFGRAPRFAVCETCVHDTVAMLTSEDLRGRACGTEDERESARRLAALFEAAGLTGAAPDGGFLQDLTFTPRGQTEPRSTYNVIGTLEGRDANAGAILISAHYDHVGVREGVLYPGANDDASGTAAVVELARMLAAGRPPRRTVEFALFACEEAGGFGSRHYADAPPTPISDLIANLQFEMIGNPDPQRPDMLMLTGFERSDLGPRLARRGAEIGPDLYPEQNFFRRSDNYRFALRGVVAHTISAWPVTPTYHQPTDTMENLDMDFMTEVIGSLAEPIWWLANSRFEPQWGEGMQPQPPAAAQ